MKSKLAIILLLCLAGCASGGILYIDRADSVFVSEAWAAEREAYNYDKPQWW